MIFVDVNGRLGNQMFYYAIARKIQLLNGGATHPLTFSFAAERMQELEGEDGYEDSLKYFQTVPYQTDNSKMRSFVKQHANILQKVFWGAEKILGRWSYDKMDHESIAAGVEKFDRCFKDIGLITYPHRLNKRRRNVELRKARFPVKNFFVSGTFENPCWFNDIKEILMEEFVPREPPIQANLSLYDIIKNTNSVCIAIRRGDYLSEQNEQCFHICDIQYYENAINYMRQTIQNPVFIAFSNDIEWVKTAPLFKENDTVYYESGNDPVWETLRLMYSCKHYIISNSTFHWWAQYLSRSEHKVVVSPDHWFWENVYWPLLSDEFVKLPTK